MPYKSRKQEAYFNANKDKLEKQGVDVNEWNQASKGKDLPERAGGASEKTPKEEKMGSEDHRDHKWNGSMRKDGSSNPMNTEGC